MSLLSEVFIRVIIHQLFVLVAEAYRISN